MSYLEPASAFGEPPRRVPAAAMRCPVCDRPPHLIGIHRDVMLGIAARQYGLTVAEMKARRRWIGLIEPRSFYVWAMRSLGVPRSYGKIGDDLGGFHHASMINLHQKAILLRLTDPDFRNACARLAERFYTSREHTHGIG